MQKQSEEEQSDSLSLNTPSNDSAYVLAQLEKYPLFSDKKMLKIMRKQSQKINSILIDNEIDQSLTESDDSFLEESPKLKLNKLFINRRKTTQVLSFDFDENSEEGSDDSYFKEAQNYKYNKFKTTQQLDPNTSIKSGKFSFSNLSEGSDLQEGSEDNFNNQNISTAIYLKQMYHQKDLRKKSMDFDWDNISLNTPSQNSQTSIENNQKTSMLFKSQKTNKNQQNVKVVQFQVTEKSFQKFKSISRQKEHSIISQVKNQNQKTILKF